MTAKTAEASTVPQPRGKPGGPGLFGIKGAQLPPYIQHVRDELIKKGKSESQATQMAIGIVRNWASHAKVSPAVKAAAAKAIADYDKLRAQAKATPNSHAHGNSPANLLLSAEYAVVELANHNPAGQLAFRYKHGWILINPAIPSRGTHGSRLATKHGHKSGGTTYGHFEHDQPGHAIFVPDRHSGAPSLAGLVQHPTKVPTTTTYKELHQTAMELSRHTDGHGTPEAHEAAARAHAKAARAVESPDLKAFHNRVAKKHLDDAHTARLPGNAKFKAAHKEAITATFKAMQSGKTEDHQLAIRKHADAAALAPHGSEEQNMHLSSVVMHSNAVQDNRAQERQYINPRPEGKFLQHEEHSDNLGDDFIGIGKKNLSEPDTGKERAQKMREFYGERLFVHKNAVKTYPNRSNIGVGPMIEPTIEEHHLANLATAHPAFHRAVKQYFDRNDNRSGIYVGEGGVDALNDIKDYASAQSKKDQDIDSRGLSEVGGVNVHNPATHHAVVGLGTVPGGSINTALHEHGHAVDLALGNPSSSPEFAKAREEAMAAMTLNPYYANTQYGHQETFAESYDAFTYAMNQDKAGTRPAQNRLARDNYIAGLIGQSITGHPVNYKQEQALMPMVSYFHTLLKEQQNAR